MFQVIFHPLKFFFKRALIVFLAFCVLWTLLVFSNTISRHEVFQVSQELLANKKVDPKIILLTKWFGSRDLWESQDANNVCSDRCIFTTNMSLWNQSSVVVFHGNNHELLNQSLTRTSRDQIWVWLNLEPAISFVFHPEHHRRLRFNWTMSYRLSSDIFTPYRRIYPRKQVPERMKIVQKFMLSSRGRSVPQEMPSLDGFSDRKMAAWIVSHCHTWSKREDLVTKLVKYFPVDIYGKCGKKLCDNEDPDIMVKSKVCRSKIQKKYKFYLSFENSLCPDYVTEKFFETLFFDMIPVVFGSADYASQFPKNSFINVLDFPSLSELVDHLTYISNNPQAWLEYFSWRKNYTIIDSHYLPAYCDVCDKLISQMESQEGILYKSYDNLHEWWIKSNSSKNSQCKTYNEVKQILSNFFNKST